VTTILPADEAVRRVELDHRLLADEIARHPLETLTDPYTVEGGPLGDFCESLHDLVAHVLMWDEISLAVLAEAGSGRRHWSLDPRWETPEVGRQLNRSGVAAGREIPAELLLHRAASVRDALVAQLQAYAPDDWSANSGPLAQYIMTVPNHDPYWHAAIHLDQLPAR
jgi:hypothetical protein